MARLYNGGRTLQSIGDDYGLTRERVRQIIKKHCGLTYQNSGRKALFVEKYKLMNQQRIERLDKRCLEKNGMARDEYRALLGLRDAGGRPPQYRFREQRANAGYRNIEWHLSFSEWWSIWLESGKWSQRGRGHGYVMSRPGDVGPYAIGNVKIIEATENSRENIIRYWNEIRAGIRTLPFAKQLTDS